MGHDVIVQFSLLYERDAGVVGHKEYGSRIELTLALECGDGLGRKNMGTDHCSEPVLLDVVVKSLAIEFVCIVNRRLGRVHCLAYGCPGFVNHTEEFRSCGKKIYFRSFVCGTLTDK